MHRRTDDRGSELGCRRVAATHHQLLQHPRFLRRRKVPTLYAAHILLRRVSGAGGNMEGEILFFPQYAHLPRAYFLCTLTWDAGSAREVPTAPDRLSHPPRTG